MRCERVKGAVDEEEEEEEDAGLPREGVGLYVVSVGFVDAFRRGGVVLRMRRRRVGRYCVIFRVRSRIDEGVCEEGSLLKARRARVVVNGCAWAWWWRRLRLGVWRKGGAPRVASSVMGFILLCDGPVVELEVEDSVIWDTVLLD